MSFSPVHVLRRAGNGFVWVERWTVMALMAFLMIFALLQIVLRNFFSTGIIWGDTLLRHVVLWISLLGAARAAAENRHIRIELLPMALHGKARFAVSVIRDVFTTAITVLLCVASWSFLRSEQLGGQIALGNIPYWQLEIIFPLSFGLMALRFGYRLVESLITGRIPEYTQGPTDGPDEDDRDKSGGEGDGLRGKAQ